MKKTLILFAVGMAVLSFLASCSSPDFLNTSPASRNGQGNWRVDGSYVLDMKSAQSVWEFIILMSKKRGIQVRPVAVPVVDEQLARVLCENIMMELQSFDDAREIIVCRGV